MRVAVSDFDGTLKIDGEVGADTITAIRQWREAGNIFGIATGRDLSMTLHETDHWKIPFDFLACLNGAVLYDDRLNVLRRTDIKDSLIPGALAHPASRASMHYALCADGEIHLCILSEISWFPSLGIPYHTISADEVMQMRSVQQISLAYETSEEARQSAEALSESFSKDLYAQHNGTCLDIIQKGVSKAGGISDMLALKGWPCDEVFVIGDGENDLSMIRRFGGFAVEGAREDTKEEATAIYGTVGEMLKAKMQPNH